MRFSWLEKMAEEGDVRPEAMERIYEHCSEIMEKSAEIDEESKKVMTALLMGQQPTVSYMGRKNYKFRVDQRTKAQTQMTKSRVIPMFSQKDQEKAEARFEEIIKYAPSLGAVEPIMRKLVKNKINGLTDQDVRALVNVQLKMMKDPLQRADYDQETSKELYQIGTKYASSKEEYLASLGGDLADGYAAVEGVFSKIARPTWGAPAKRPRTLPASGKDILKFLGLSLGASALGTGLTAGLQMIKEKQQENRMKASLNDSLQKVMVNLKPTGVTPAKAEKAFKTLVHFAPHIAAEPVAATTFVKRLSDYGNEVETSDLKALTEIQRNMSGQNSGALNAIQMGLNEAGFNRTLGQAWGTVMQAQGDHLNQGMEERIKEGL